MPTFTTNCTLVQILVGDYMSCYQGAGCCADWNGENGTRAEIIDILGGDNFNLTDCDIPTCLSATMPQTTIAETSPVGAESNATTSFAETSATFTTPTPVGLAITDSCPEKDEEIEACVEAALGGVSFPSSCDVLEQHSALIANCLAKTSCCDDWDANVAHWRSMADSLSSCDFGQCRELTFESATHVVSMQVSLSYSAQEFAEGTPTRTNFIAGVANTAGVPVELVIVRGVVEVNRRRLLATSVLVDIEIAAASEVNASTSSLVQVSPVFVF